MIDQNKESTGKSSEVAEPTNHSVLPPTPEERYEHRNFVDTAKAVWNYSILYDDDIETFQRGTHYSLYKKFGSKRMTVLDREGYYFSVWAPNATKVSVTGNFNNWNPDTHLFHPRWDKSGIWE